MTYNKYDIIIESSIDQIHNIHVSVYYPVEML